MPTVFAAKGEKCRLCGRMLQPGQRLTIHGNAVVYEFPEGGELVADDIEWVVEHKDCPSGD